MTEKLGDLYFIMWDDLGLDGLVNVSELQREDVLRSLQTEGGIIPQAVHTLSAMLLRARYNSQRHYEVYSISVASGIEEDDLRNLFESDIKATAELIRERGHSFFSGRDKGE